MHYFLLIILFCFLVFLYCLFVLGNDDFIFLRKDVAMEKLFNLSFLGVIFAIFFARLFYGFSAKTIFSNLLVFFLIPYFPGLSLLGGVVGIGMFYLYLKYSEKENFPLARIYDFFSLAFLISLPIGFIGYILFSGHSLIIKSAIQAIFYFTIFIIFLKFFLPKLLNGKFKEGTITFIFLIAFSLFNLIVNAFSKISITAYFESFENFILIVIFILSTGTLIYHENLLSKIKWLKRK